MDKVKAKDRLYICVHKRKGSIFNGTKLRRIGLIPFWKLNDQGCTSTDINQNLKEIYGLVKLHYYQIIHSSYDLTAWQWTHHCSMLGDIAPEPYTKYCKQYENHSNALHDDHFVSGKNNDQHS